MRVRTSDHDRVVAAWRRCAADTGSRFSTGSMRAASVRVFGLGRQGAVVNAVFRMVIVPWLGPLWVKSRHRGTPANVRFTSKSRHSPMLETYPIVSPVQPAVRSLGAHLGPVSCSSGEGD